MEITYEITKDEFIEGDKLLFLKTYIHRSKQIIIILSILVFIYNLFNEKDIINFTLNTTIPIVLLILLLVVEGKIITILHEKLIAKKIETSWSGNKKLIISDGYIKYVSSPKSYEALKDNAYIYEIKEYIYIAISKRKVVIVPKNKISEEDKNFILNIK